MKKNKTLPWLIIAIELLFFIVAFVKPELFGTNREDFNKKFILFNKNNGEELEKIDVRLTLELEDDGYDVYVPTKKGYRYGPSIIYYEDGTRDVWFASNGNNREWDWITYRHYDGKAWGSEEVVLRPTKNSLDLYSVCDPGVIYFNDYYYLGYTSTTNPTGGGIENNIFVCRSKNPNGPFEKWNGESWGGKPSPIITYENNDSKWGAGEISFVVKEEELYCYYSWNCSTGNYTKLAKADLVDDWPLTLREKGIVIYKVNGEDSYDVFYNDDYDRFLAVSVGSRFTDKSYLCIYESKDGKSFKKANVVEGKIEKYAHNLGVSKKLDGHVDFDDKLIIGYAYSQNNTWAKWSTKMQAASLKLYSE